MDHPNPVAASTRPATNRKPLLRRLRDAVRWHSRPLRGWLKHRVWRRLIPYRPSSPIRLHIGSGMQRLEGWVNIDIQRLPEVDIAGSVTDGLPFEQVEAVFAEHFLEHLQIAEALDFLQEAHRVLHDEGLIRLSTPNLDWVWKHVYSQQDPMRTGLHANRAFYGWEHRFLWNRPLLEEALRATGFRSLECCRWGESSHQMLRGIERHETYEDTPEVPHVLIIEASKGKPQPERLRRFQGLLHEELLQFSGN